MARCVGYAKSRSGRCAVDLERGPELWQDSTTGAAGGSVDGPPRCHYHPPATDPEGWIVQSGEGAAPPPREGAAPDPGAGERPDLEPAPVADPRPNAPAGPPPEPEPEPEEPDADLFAGLEPAPDATVDPSVTGTERPERVAGLEDTVRDILGDELEESEETDTEPDLEPDLELDLGPAAAGASLAGPDPARVKGWQRRARSLLEGPVNGKLRRDEVAPLEPDEVDVGAEVVGEALAEVLSRVDPNNPYGAALLWAVVTFVPRYVGRGIGERRAASSSPEEPTAEPAGPEPDNAPSEAAADTSRPGWAADLDLVGER